MSFLRIDMTCGGCVHFQFQKMCAHSTANVLHCTSITVLSSGLLTNMKNVHPCILEPPSFASVRVEFSCDVAIMDPIPVTVNWMVRSIVV